MTPETNESTSKAVAPRVVVPYRVLVAIDFSETAARALTAAIDLVVRGKPRCELHVVCVVDDHGSVETPHGGGEVAMGLDDLQKTMRKLVVDGLSAAGVKRDTVDRPLVLAHLRVGEPGREIPALAAELDADLVVLGTHGRHGLQRLWLGSVAERVMRLATCPVLVVRPKGNATSLEAYQPEPACPKCLAKRKETQGRVWWCDEHDRPAADAHVYRYSSALDYEPDLYNVVW